MLSSGTLLANRYRAIRPLGGGGMKQVYLAEDTRLANRQCALAEMIEAFTDPKEQQVAAAAFAREADMLAQLKHPRIPHVYDHFSEQNRHFLVMEYVEGETLEDRLKSSPNGLPETTVIDVALQVLEALEYLHGRTPPVIFRDLKPSNIMLAPDGGVKLIDFGIARLFVPQKTATMVGTQGYAPPEQYEGKAEPRTDLFALGATMFHVLTGWDPALHPPFMFPAIDTLRAGVNPALSALITEALALDLKQRIGSAAEFRRRLENIKSPSGNLRSAAYPATPRVPAAASSSEATTVTTLMATKACPRCGRDVPADAVVCPYCSAQLKQVVTLTSKSRTWVRAAGGLAALIIVGVAGAFGYQYFQQYEQTVQARTAAGKARLAAAEAHPLALKSITLAPASDSGAPLGGPATSFTDVQLAKAGSLKWTAELNNLLVGLEGANQSVRAALIGPDGKEAASTNASAFVKSSDNTVEFGGLLALRDQVRKTFGTYQVALYRGDALLGKQNFAIGEDATEAAANQKVAQDAAQKAAAERRAEAEADRKNGDELYSQKRNDEAVSSWRKAVELGDGQAASDIGYYYRAQKNDSEAASWYHKSADLGDGDGASALATIYNDLKEPAKAHDWYLKAAELYRKKAAQGDRSSAGKLGYLYSNKDELDNQREARTWYQKAAELDIARAERGDAEAADDAAGIYKDHLGNYALARKWYQKALSLYLTRAQQGDAKAMGKVASLYGYGELKDTEQRKIWNERYAQAEEKLAQTGDPNAAVVAGDAYDSAGNWAKGAQMWKEVANAPGQTYTYPAKDAAEDLIKTGDYAAADEWFEKAAQVEGDPKKKVRELENAGDAFNDAKQFDRATAWYQKAADQGDTYAGREIARVYAEQGQCDRAVQILEHLYYTANNETDKGYTANLLRDAYAVTSELRDCDKSVYWFNQAQLARGDQSMDSGERALLTQSCNGRPPSLSCKNFWWR